MAITRLPFWSIANFQLSFLLNTILAGRIRQSGLTDEQIKQVSRAQIVRNIAPGQPVTMDYRENRVTVVTDPSTKKIVKVSCG